MPLGVARVAREGTDLTIVTYGNLWPRSMVAAEKLATEHGISAEVIDLRTVDAGYDRTTILKSLRKTGHVLVADEDRAIGGFGSSVASEIASNWWHELAGPIGLVHPKFSRVSYGPSGEKAVMPNPDDIVAEEPAGCAAALFFKKKKKKKGEGPFPLFFFFFFYVLYGGG